MSSIRSPESGVRSPVSSVADLGELYLVQNPESRIRIWYKKAQSPLSESISESYPESRVRDPTPEEKKYRHAPRESRIRSPDFLKLTAEEDNLRERASREREKKKPLTTEINPKTADREGGGGGGDLARD